MKTCFKCDRTLPITEFYAHPKMGDGHLGKCKDCTKKDTAERLERKLCDPEFAELEAARHRAKQARYRQIGTAIQLTGAEREKVHKRHKLKYPEKYHARTVLGVAVQMGKVIRKPCIVCGSLDSEGHHEDYSKPLEVIWLCPRHHADRHLELRRGKSARLISA